MNVSNLHPISPLRRAETIDPANHQRLHEKEWIIHPYLQALFSMKIFTNRPPIIS